MSEEYTNVSAITEEVMASTANLLDSIQNISGITSENVESTYFVSNFVLEQNNHIDTISRATVRLNEMAGKLEKIMSGFKLN